MKTALRIFTKVVHINLHYTVILITRVGVVANFDLLGACTVAVPAKTILVSIDVSIQITGVPLLSYLRHRLGLVVSKS